MGNIIALNIRPERQSQPASSPESHRAEIVIFPGVRYERASEPQPENNRGSRGRRQRDVLVISD